MAKKKSVKKVSEKQAIKKVELNSPEALGLVAKDFVETLGLQKGKKKFRNFLKANIARVLNKKPK